MATSSSDTGRLSPPALAARSAQTLNSRREPAKPPLQGHCRLVMDATGVGAPVVDLLRQAELRPVAVIITGGDKVTSGKGSLYVPKRDLVDAPLGDVPDHRGLDEAGLHAVLVQVLLDQGEMVRVPGQGVLLVQGEEAVLEGPLDGRFPGTDEDPVCLLVPQACLPDGEGQVPEVARRRSSSSRVMMPSAMEWATLCSHPSSRPWLTVVPFP